jgi:hypothetical protein
MKPHTLVRKAFSKRISAFVFVARLARLAFELMADAGWKPESLGR